MVSVVGSVIDRLDISAILSTYRGGGNSAFNPRTVLKILVFAYLSNVYSSRRIAELLCPDIYFMWLSGMKRPDFRTINYYLRKLALAVASSSFLRLFCLKELSKKRFSHWESQKSNLCRNYLTLRLEHLKFMQKKKRLPNFLLLDSVFF